MIHIADWLYDKHLRKSQTKMAKKFSELRAKMSPAAREESTRVAAELRRELPLHQLRQALKLSREKVAEELGVTQAAISRLEHRPDVFVSTLRRFIEAMGGELEVRAHFPTRTVTLADLGMAVHATR
jgi:DNA-binding transcriptional regulator YiaG